MLKRYLPLLLGVVLCLPGSNAAAEEVRKVLFVAGHPSHAPGEHEHRAGCMLLAKSLERAMPNFETEVHWYGWPDDEEIFEGIDALVMYCDGGPRHYANRHLDFIQGLVDKGVGIVALHYGVEVPIGESGDKFLQWIGGYFETDWSVNPHWTANFEKLPEHPITNGVDAFTVHDEWYYHMRFPENMENVTPILTAMPGPETLSRPDGPHSGNPHVRKAIENGEEQHVAWAIQRPDGGRGFGYTGGHFHKNWRQDEVRKVVLNAIVWAANGEIPENGAESPTPTDEEMEENLDPKGRRR